MKICPVCKSAVPDDAEYCDTCGNDEFFDVVYVQPKQPQYNDAQQYKSMKKIKTFFKLSKQDKMQLNHRGVCKILDTFVDNDLIPKRVEMSFEEMQKEIDTLRRSNEQLLAIQTNLQNRIKELECEISNLQNSVPVIGDCNEKKAAPPIPKVPESPKKKVTF